MIKSLSAMLKQDKERFEVPKSVQDAIPIRRIWPDGIFQVGNKFSKSIRFSDINYAIASKADKTDIVRMENELKPKVEIALEGYQAVSGKLTVLEDKIDNLTSKVESQDVQITVLKGSKKAAK